MRDLQRPGRSVARGANGAAATSQPISTYIAIEVLRHGGNAVDAALTACALQSVLEPHNTGIGGDCFAFVWRADQQRLHAVAGAGWAPEALDTRSLLEAGIAVIAPTSIHAATVPGALHAWSRLLADHGTRTLAEVLAPTIDYAERGVVVAERVSEDWARAASLLAGDAAASDQLLPHGRAPRAGEIVTFPLLAKTLRVIAAEGADAFYRGTIAERLVETLRERGGRHSLADFAEYSSRCVEPVGVDYRGVRVLQMPPSGQGLTALLMLNILAGYEHAGLDPLGPRRLHLQIEAARRAYAVRDAFLADPDFNSTPVTEILAPAFAERIRARIDLGRASALPAGVPAIVPRDTVALTVVDGAGNACSIVNSLFDAFGCGKVCPRTGVTFQSRGAGFRVDPGHPNTVEGRKRPLHTIIPGMVMRHGRPLIAYGVMGGAYQPVGHVHVLQNMLDFGMDVQEALDCPRAFAAGPVFEAERGVPEETLQHLAAMGHSVARADQPLGGGQAILVSEGALHAGSDPRKDGIALAY